VVTRCLAKALLRRPGAPELVEELGRWEEADAAAPADPDLPTVTVGVAPTAVATTRLGAPGAPAVPRAGRISLTST